MAALQIRMAASSFRRTGTNLYTRRSASHAVPVRVSRRRTSRRWRARSARCRRLAAPPRRKRPALRPQTASLPPRGPSTGTDDETTRNRLRMVKAVDEGMGEILHALERTGQLNNTVIIFTSDEGYFFGEHGLSIER